LFENTSKTIARGKKEKKKDLDSANYGETVEWALPCR